MDLILVSTYITMYFGYDSTQIIRKKQYKIRDYPIGQIEKLTLKFYKKIQMKWFNDPPRPEVGNLVAHLGKIHITGLDVEPHSHLASAIY